jgi:hypothetical protein
MNEERRITGTPLEVRDSAKPDVGEPSCRVKLGDVHHVITSARLNEHDPMLSPMLRLHVDIKSR